MVFFLDLFKIKFGIATQEPIFVHPFEKEEANNTMRIRPFAVIKESVEWAHIRLTQRQFLLLASVLVGISVGFAAIVLKLFVHLVFYIATYDKWGDFKYLYLVLPVIGIFLTVLINRKLLNGQLVKGLGHLHTVIASRLSFVPRREMYDQIVTSSVTVGFGGSTGLEAPIVITGAAFGSNFAKAHRLNYNERTLLLACGIAAGIAAAFNAPIAGVLFAVEVFMIDITISAFIPLIIAAATGALISKVVLGGHILLSFTLKEHFEYMNVPFYVLLGILAGFVAVYHSRVFTRVEGWFAHKKANIYVKVLWGGIGLAALIFIFPTLFGEGYQSIMDLAEKRPQNILDQSVLNSYQSNEYILLLCIGLLIFVKPIATALTIGSGGNGGNVAPSLFIGAYLGYLFSRIVNLTQLAHIPTNNFTIVGMAGVLSGIYHAPLTAIFLIAEITGGYSLMIPLMIVSSISYAISRYYEPYSMDTKKMATSGKIFTENKDSNVLVTIKTQQLIETDVVSLEADSTLDSLIQAISQSKRSIFPVLETDGTFLGVILLDDVREIMFKPELYQHIQVKELMTPAPAILSSEDTMLNVMKRFDETNAWALPVVDNGKFVGLITKTGVFNSYREKLKDSSF